VSVGLYVTWIILTTLGALFAQVVGDPKAYGFDIAFPAVLLSLLRSIWKGVRAARPWTVSLAAAATTHRLVPGAWYVAAGGASGVASSGKAPPFERRADNPNILDRQCRVRAGRFEIGVNELVVL
jgi:predicted branched-subunit amino acid permease